MDTVGGLFSTIATPPRSASPMPPQAEQQDELPSESIPPAPTTPPMLEATSTDPLTTPLFHQLYLLHRRHPSPYLPQRPSEPIALAEETIRVDVPSQTTHEAATEPSSPLESPTT
ncbi:hypothetical protein CK203_064382 [Vitis vinifera]|uniref:Uncharacterized protein n=1 Tax=Vitis vinifera TaxID=29760 RepID=A0A438G6T8_VITVI|nr:hypothetical protein CK203_064382 [Vitis vinifera]